MDINNDKVIIKDLINSNNVYELKCLILNQFNMVDEVRRRIPRLNFKDFIWDSWVDQYKSCQY